MDEKTIFALAILLCFFSGLNIAGGKALISEKKGQVEPSKTPTFDLFLLFFNLVSIGYLIGTFWHVILISFEGLIMIGACLFGASLGYKVIRYREEKLAQAFLCFSWAAVPAIFHLGMS
ncbi:hypothetical protein HJ029_07545 [Vibrio parahaemolyticus]|nr:hypothetical protein [Vibrio parahaemolyticus]